jgi:NAD(P)-dependent dehydrogenase (short-subunit alcohol dehydrogenase family)
MLGYIGGILDVNSMTIDMKNKVCIVTGANSGIGKATALGLARMGSRVVMVCRNMERGENARSEIIEKSGNKSVDLLICDVSSMSSIRKFAAEYSGKYPRLDVLINNAGAVFNTRSITEEDFERTFALDLLGPVLLSHELMPILRKNAPSRIINISSGLHKNGVVDLGNLQSDGKYNGMKVYSNTKLMLMMFTYEQARRLQGTGVTFNVVLPGFAATNLGKNSESLMSNILFRMVRPMQISPEEAAETVIYLASSDEVRDVSGKCFEKMKQRQTAPQSYDQDMQLKIWEKANTLLGITFW